MLIIMAIHKETIEINKNNFKNRKNLMLSKLRAAIRSSEVDVDILPHLDIINSMPFCFTTSSCSGRIALIDAPLLGPKYESTKAFRWHSTVDITHVWAAISEYLPRHILWLKFDSFIISFSTYSIRWATFFIRLARYINLKDSGIRSINPKAGYINLDFMSTEKLSIPVKSKGKLLISYESLVHVINIANFLMKKNRIKLDMLKECLKITLQHAKIHEYPPNLSLFDQVLQEYRKKLSTLKNDPTFIDYEETYISPK